MSKLRGWLLLSLAWGLAAALVAGCGDTGSQPPTAQNEPRDTPPPPLPPPQAEPQPKPQPVYKKAEPGVGVKRGGGLYAASTYFTIRETIIFENIEHAMQLYKAEHDNKGPKTHDEFMEKIIKANNIQLPQLQVNERYVYDPQREELMVEVLPQ